MTGHYSVKILALIKKKAGISRKEFMDHYENVHVPLIKRLIPYFADYRRNYVGSPIQTSSSVHDTAGFDAVTEVWFATQTDYEKFCRAAGDPAIANQIADDELKFLDPAATRMFVVEERGIA